MGITCSVDTTSGGFELSEEEEAKCREYQMEARHFPAYEGICHGIKVAKTDMVVHIRILHKLLSADGNKNAVVILEHNNAAIADYDQICRKLRIAIVTGGTFHLVSRNQFLIIDDPLCGCSQFLKPRLYENEMHYPNIVVPIKQMRNVCFDTAREQVVISALQRVHEQQQDDQHQPVTVVYQMPDPSTLLESLLITSVSAYAGVPDWAIPIQWQLPKEYISVSPILPQMYETVLGNDGGFASAFYSAACALFIQTRQQQHDILSKNMYKNKHILKNIKNFDPKSLILDYLDGNKENSLASSMSLNLLDVAKTLVAEERKRATKFIDANHDIKKAINDMEELLVIEGLDCLPFNLKYRTLSVEGNVQPLNNDYNKSASSFAPKFCTSLARIFMYNVTLREINLQNRNLNGFGIELGQALCMNIQPFITRINLSNCGLSDQDFRGLLPGFIRLWCGGSNSGPEYINFSSNSLVEMDSWDMLFKTLVDPTQFPFFSVNATQVNSTTNTIAPPPPPTLCHLQYFNIVGTHANRAPALALFISKLSGLLHLGIQDYAASQAQNTMGWVINALAGSNAPLRTFHGESFTSMNSSALAMALQLHGKTLKDVTLRNCKLKSPYFAFWQEPVPYLTMKFVGNSFNQIAFDGKHNPSSQASAPGCIEWEQDENNSTRPQFVTHFIPELTMNASGLKCLKLEGIFHGDLAPCAFALAYGGLEELILSSQSPTEFQRVISIPSEQNNSTTFFTIMATSKTLKTLHIVDQIFNSRQRVQLGPSTQGGFATNCQYDGLNLIGPFLKSNRSVRSLCCDGTGFFLHIEGIKLLRSAFYGNKKVIHMEYLKKAEEQTMKFIVDETQRCVNEVMQCKANIKMIFKSHYSKYNYNWRDKPNQLKLPYVERIRIAKRAMGAMEREVKNISRLLNEIKSCVQSNRIGFDNITKEKETTQLERRGNQLQTLATKKESLLTKLVTKLHKAKIRGRKGKSGKEQIPRYAYYHSKDMWPKLTRKRQTKPIRTRMPHSRYNAYNDPYGMRWHYYHYHPWYHCYYYDYGCHWNNHPCYCNHNNHHHSDHVDENVGIGITQDAIEVTDSAGRGVDDGQQTDQIIEAPPFVIDKEMEMATTGAVGAATTLGDHIPLKEDIESSVMIPPDPWAAMDGMVDGDDAIIEAAGTQEYLDGIHMEAAELGPDVIADIAPVLDQLAGVDAKISEISDKSGVDESLINTVVNSQVTENFAVDVIQRDLPDIPEYAGDPDIGYDPNVGDDLDIGYDDDDVDDLNDDGVDMYAGAGPRDLDDGGNHPPPYAEAVLAGARRRAMTRKKHKRMKRVRDSLRRRRERFTGYERLTLISSGMDEMNQDRPRIKNCHNSSKDHSWPEKLEEHWKQEVTSCQVDALSKNHHLFTVPDVASSDCCPKQIMEWSSTSQEATIEVALVTQCSLDRLSNLKEQLIAWNGRASIAIYLKASESFDEAESKIKKCVEEARSTCVLKRSNQVDTNIFSYCNHLSPLMDVAISIVQNTCWSESEELYPINYLRNVALLQAKEEQLKRKNLQNSAVFLVDVDFRPSIGLHDALHCPSAALAIVGEKKVVVCPAFESSQSTKNTDATLSNTSAITVPQTMSDLKSNVSEGYAEGFHISQFPHGHLPTDYEAYWAASSFYYNNKEESQSCCKEDENRMENVDKLWELLYPVRYRKFFEPYIVMATTEVPLYDERFQGYGMNKIAHVESVAVKLQKRKKQQHQQKVEERNINNIEGKNSLFDSNIGFSGVYFWVLPGIFIIAPIHQRSDSYSKIYGSISDDTKFNRLCLKGLYRNFLRGLYQGHKPIVSCITKEKVEQLQHYSQQQRDRISTITPSSCNPTNGQDLDYDAITKEKVQFLTTEKKVPACLILSPRQDYPILPIWPGMLNRTELLLVEYWFEEFLYNQCLMSKIVHTCKENVTHKHRIKPISYKTKNSCLLTTTNQTLKANTPLL